MSRKLSTPLALIMHHLHISSVELASAIHVDPSLISRWKNKSRPFNSTSNHYAPVINYILDKDTRLNYQNIILFLSDHIPESNLNDRDEIYRTLDLWLSGHYYQSHSDTTSIHLSELPITDVGIIKGEKEKKDALLHILDITLELQEKKKLFLLFDDSTDILLDQISFYDLWIQRLHEIIQKGHEVYFIYNSNSQYSNVVNLHNFLHLTQFPNYHAYYLRKNSIPYFDLYVLEDVLALTSFSAISDRRKVLLFSFSHPDIIGQMKRQCENILLHCEKPFDYNKRVNVPRVLDSLKSMAYIKQRIIMYMTSPFSFPVTPETFKKVLEYNQFTVDEIECTLQEYETIIYNPFMLSENNLCICLMNIDNIYEAIRKPSYTLYPKLLSNRDIIIPKELYSLYIQEFLGHISERKKTDADYSISTVSNASQALPENIFIYTVSDLCTYIYSEILRYNENHMVIANPLFTNDIFTYLEQIYMDLPETNHKNNQLFILLNQMLHELQD